MLTEFNNTLQIVIEKVLRFEIKFIFLEAILVSFHHHENDLLVLVRTFEEVLEVTLLLNLILSLLNMIDIVTIILLLIPP